ncbi:unnamed protein product [Penicillium olsonii]|uniref:Uncharacterized protein n=1 Tax=Penicillium olsonii TaxID=99116 RepID=A0A9W4HTX7_PENOL|nr:unnamed protein product [Penicillium olsonii]CAG8165488.1 unnamed protein product [Penicillium olsonii]
MRAFILALWAIQCSRVFGDSYPAENPWIVAPTAISESALAPEPTEPPILPQRRAYGELFMRDATTESDSTSTTESTTSETSTSETTSETSSTSTSSTSTSSTTTSSSTSSTTSTSTSTTSSSTSSTTSSISTSSATTSSSTSSTSTTSTSSTTSSTATSTSTESAELKEWNRRGNIAAIVFGCCMISLFSGISIVYCVREKAKRRRIAARELLRSGASIPMDTPPGTSKGSLTAEPKLDRSSMMFTNHPSTEYFPTAQSEPLVSNYHSHTPSADSQNLTEQSSTRAYSRRADADEHTMGMV